MDSVIRIVEGNFMPDAPVEGGSVEELLAELMLPEALTTLTDRCDKCGAEALHAFVFKNAEGELSVILTCNHHGRALARSGAPYVAHKDYRVPFEDFVAQNEAQQAEAMKQIQAGKLDDSNYVAACSTGASAYKAQWDLQYWGKR